jgi:hypothetical protein
MILSPYSNRGERIGARISVYEGGKKEMIEYTWFIYKKGPASTLKFFWLERIERYVRLVLFLPRESLRPDKRGLSPAGALSY